MMTTVKDPSGQQPDTATQLAEPVATQQTERVTKPKDPKKVAAGRACAAARKAKQDWLLKELQGAKEKLHERKNDDASDVALQRSKESVVISQQQHIAVAEQQRQAEQEHHGNPPEGQTGWTPWIFGVCLAGGIVVAVSIVATSCFRHAVGIRSWQVE